MTTNIITLTGEPATITASWRGTVVSANFESAGGLWLDLLADLRNRLATLDGEGADELAAAIIVALHDHDEQLAALDCA